MIDQKISNLQSLNFKLYTLNFKFCYQNLNYFIPLLTISCTTNEATSSA